ncbi:TetR family transcriptional regulator C-terminal domain-containing protein [Spelaeicoccus albus]|uniref:AcrR family transcriptional regulator n=1 Tax=Spelaeicoccus albus TaxID=1280376 RepID=A0A7Z0IGZ6_9MICO|nr:TetR family transcriptional regulator C-terminal domain-containing protein [Spelaeicoccus albus]NYI67445.1 AcrR family transcriptional regulator [Spelaeicoccus albus]
MSSASEPPAPSPDDDLGPDSAAVPSTRMRVRTAIADSGMAQREVSRAMGLDETKLSKSLRGTRRFMPAELIRLADVTGATVSWLLATADDDAASATPAPRAMPTLHREDSEHAKKRRDIVETAWKLIAARGYASVRIADIASACGTSSATVHYYFPSKRELFEESLRYSVKLAFDRQVAVLYAIDDPVARLKKLVDLQTPDDEVVGAEWSIWLQTWADVAVGAGAAENHRQGYARWFQTVRDAIAAGQQAGLVIDGPLDGLALELTAIMDGLGIKVLTGIIDVAAMKGRLIDFIDRALLTDAGREKGITP